jgi:hypothetical protein
VILIATIGTMGVAIAAYVAFKLRDKRKPSKKDPAPDQNGEVNPIFLTRYKPEAPSSDQASVNDTASVTKP